MSETQQGPDWWMASDGRWYPPASNSFAPPPPYATYPYVPVQTSGKATAVMVLGIVGVALMCGYGIGVVPAIVALALAPGARREIQTSGGRLQGEGQIKAGVICSWVAVGVVGLALVALVAILIISAVGSSA
jgi:hypothetical protein